MNISVDQRSPDEDPYDDDESEEDFDLRDVSSGVEIDPAELDVPSDDEGYVVYAMYSCRAKWGLQAI